ncbi:BgtE-20100 [Blumeria graminis f. sp. tritici]|uniref:BgtE-20100 n=2 Tax=Blumeria graminis f. sp. tritici TaxID=62690 RepID=A0A381L2U5_BLUGR|nr:BgtE-20100 [Blumeria graminis f. sp. tritici]
MPLPTTKVKFLYIAGITKLLSLFTSCDAQAGNGGHLMYTCNGQGFYSDSVETTATTVENHGFYSINGYPILYQADGLSGPGPHKLYPMLPSTLIYTSGSVSIYFLIVDRRGTAQGMVYSSGGQYVTCDKA